MALIWNADKPKNMMSSLSEMMKKSTSKTKWKVDTGEGLPAEVLEKIKQMQASLKSGEMMTASFNPHTGELKVSETKEVPDDVLDALKENATTLLEEAPKTILDLKIDSITVDETENQALVREYVDLKTKYDELDMKATIDRMEQIKKQLQGAANEEGVADQPYVFETDYGQMVYSPRANTKVVANKTKLFDYLLEKHGSEALMSVINVAMGPLGKVLSAGEMKKFIINEPGSRSLESAKKK